MTFAPSCVARTNSSVVVQSPATFAMDPRARDPRLAGRGTAVAAPASGARLAPGSGAGSSGSGPVGAGAGTSGGVPSLAQRKDFGVALVCACNMNRSMSAHKLLMENGFEKVASYGTARCVKLPGGPSGVRTFDFGQPYSLMEADLRTADARALKWCVRCGRSTHPSSLCAFVSPQLCPVTQHLSYLSQCRMNDRKIFGMLTRNQGIKKAPEHWREEKSPQRFDLIICFEQRVFDSLVEGGVHMLPRCARQLSWP